MLWLSRNKTHQKRGSNLTFILGGNFQLSTFSSLARAKMIISCPGYTLISKFFSCLAGSTTSIWFLLNSLNRLKSTHFNSWPQSIYRFLFHYGIQCIHSRLVGKVSDRKESWDRCFRPFSFSFWDRRWGKLPSGHFYVFSSLLGWSRLWLRSEHWLWQSLGKVWCYG